MEVKTLMQRSAFAPVLALWGTAFAAVNSFLHDTHGDWTVAATAVAAAIFATIAWVKAPPSMDAKVVEMTCPTPEPAKLALAGTSATFDVGPSKTTVEHEAKIALLADMVRPMLPSDRQAALDAVIKP